MLKAASLNDVLRQSLWSCFKSPHASLVEAVIGERRFMYHGAFHLNRMQKFLETTKSEQILNTAILFHDIVQASDKPVMDSRACLTLASEGSSLGPLEHATCQRLIASTCPSLEDRVYTGTSGWLNQADVEILFCRHQPSVDEAEERLLVEYAHVPRKEFWKARYEQVYKPFENKTGTALRNLFGVRLAAGRNHNLKAFKAHMERCKRYATKGETDE